MKNDFLLLAMLSALCALGLGWAWWQPKDQPTVVHSAPVPTPSIWQDPATGATCYYIAPSLSCLEGQP